VTRSIRLTRWVAFLIVILTIASAAAGFLVVRKDIDAMRRAGKETILWSAMQVEVELLRFQNALSEFNSNQNSVTPKQINERFDILWSRVSLFRQGSVGARLRAYDTPKATVAQLFVKMHEIEPLVTGLTRGDRTSASAIKVALAPFQSDLRLLSQNVLHGEESKTAVLREDLSQSSSILTVVSAVAILASFLLIFVFARESGRFRKLAGENRRLLDESRRVNKSKSQFLAMMSHELRTPMNGVLGLLALVRQQGLSSHQVRLLDQAERSGSQMIALLRDILDFSALQDNQLKLETKPFEVRRLVAAIGDMFEPVAVREGIRFSASVDLDCPERIMGDFARLRQALTHLATYILETAGTKDIALNVNCKDGYLKASLSFGYSQIGGAWDPDLIMGKGSGTTGGFASEVLGPAVSRGLIERMGGTTKLGNPTPDRIAVLVSVPAKELVVDTLLIRVITQSTALAAICKAALRAENVRFLDENDTQSPHVVMLEAGGEREVASIKACAIRYPNALLVALGKPRDPDMFTDIVDVPIDIANIRQSGFMSLAPGRTQLAEPQKMVYPKRNNATAG